MAEELVRAHYPWFWETFQSYDMEVKKADAARVFILHCYGGLYLDLVRALHVCVCVCVCVWGGGGGGGGGCGISCDGPCPRCTDAWPLIACTLVSAGCALLSQRGRFPAGPRLCRAGVRPVLMQAPAANAQRELLAAAEVVLEQNARVTNASASGSLLSGLWEAQPVPRLAAQRRCRPAACRSGLEGLNNGMMASAPGLPLWGVAAQVLTPCSPSSAHAHAHVSWNSAS